MPSGWNRGPSSEWQVWGKTGQKIYGEKVGVEYPENPLRFAIFCQAALQAPLLLHLAEDTGLSSPYGEDVVFVVNDWHAALVPLYLKSRFQPRGTYANAKVAMCVHNLAYQGQFDESEFEYSTLDLPAEFRPAFQQQIPVVASTGGFLDSVRDGVTGLHLGRFGVKPEGGAEDVIKAVKGLKRAIEVFSTPHFRRMVVAAMSQDLSWKGPARAWEQALLSLSKDARKEGRETTEVFPGEKVEKHIPARGAAKETLPATVSR
ncbi:hypothetical protein CBR_g74072 [Chara braunii]|uniref:Starch synthase catalytic domain-containing protein n=1 Tax=Chara braunii TaxID=69332 RepID=A0A388JJJ5_CHABU|nr:hypothetical protein CBR_g74072 [Chara braunii]|eukprot:GBG41191.1 hypothetical protein CBR_g74072 [Chara braunii]